MTNTDIVKKLVGNIQPAGDTNIDNERFENLKAMCELADNLIAEINEVVYRNDTRNEYSVRQMVEYASGFLTDMRGEVK